MIPQKLIDLAEKELYGFTILDYYMSHEDFEIEDLLYVDLGMNEYQMQVGIDFLGNFDWGETNGLL